MFLQTPGTGPQLGRMLGVAGGGCSRVQQAQGVAVITGIPEQRMQININTVMNSICNNLTHWWRILANKIVMRRETESNTESANS